MKLQQNLTERIARELVKLEATEFLGRLQKGLSIHAPIVEMKHSLIL